MLEFLRALKVPVTESHPRRYWDMNWRKFVTLWHLARDLRARFFLINYATDEVNFGPFHVMRSAMNIGCAPAESLPITTFDVRTGHFDDFARWLRNLESEVESISPVRCYYCQGFLALDLERCCSCDANVCRSCHPVGSWACERCIV